MAKLKTQLKARGLPAAGAKPSLVAALTAALAADTATQATGKACGKAVKAEPSSTAKEGPPAAEPVTPAQKPVRLQS